MTLEEFLASRKDATAEDLSFIRGLYDVLKGEHKEVDLEPYAKREDFNQLKEALTKLEDKVVEGTRSANDNSPIDEPLRKAMRSLFDNIKKGERQGVELPETSIRAAAIMTMADMIAQAPDLVKTTIDKSIHAAPAPRLGVVSRLNKGATRTATTRYTSLNGTEGNAAITAEGALKPLFSTKYTNAEVSLRKIAVRIKVSEEFEDFTEFYNDLVKRARRALETELEKEVVNGVGGADHVAGIVSVAPAFNVPALALSVKTPSIVDVILAMATQSRALGFNPNVAFVNYLDYAKLFFTKDSTGRPMATEDMARLAGITIIPVDGNSITAGKALVMEDAFWNLFVNEVKVKEGYGVTKVGTEYVSDLDVNLRTVIFETYVKSYCAAPELGSVVYDTIATVQTAIAAV